MENLIDSVPSFAEPSTFRPFERWMRLAFAEARTAFAISEVPIGAVFVLHPILTNAVESDTISSANQFLSSVDFERGEVVATGYNKTVVNKNVCHSLLSVF
jgi:hypothetical protein